MSEAKKLGIIGGTFDPIHYGHLRAAEEARLDLPLERVIFIPAALPPHKLTDPLSAPEHRLEMVRRAVADNPGFLASDVEISKPGRPSYTVETVEYFRSRFHHNDIFYIIGMDSFLEIPTWKDFSRLFELCHVVVVTRPGSPSRDRFGPPPELLSLLRPAGNGLFLHPSGNRVIIFPITGFDISSTQIRNLVRSGKSIRYLLPPEVEEYIREKRLYRDE